MRSDANSSSGDYLESIIPHAEAVVTYLCHLRASPSCLLSAYVHCTTQWSKRVRRLLRPACSTLAWLVAYCGNKQSCPGSPVSLPRTSNLCTTLLTPACEIRDCSQQHLAEVWAAFQTWRLVANYKQRVAHESGGGAQQMQTSLTDVLRRWRALTAAAECVMYRCGEAIRRLQDTKILSAFGTWQAATRALRVSQSSAAMTMARYLTRCSLWKWSEQATHQHRITGTQRTAIRCIASKQRANRFRLWRRITRVAERSVCLCGEAIRRSQNRQVCCAWALWQDVRKRVRAMRIVAKCAIMHM